MAIANQTNKTSGSGNGVTTTFSFPFLMFDPSESLLYTINAATGVITGPLTLYVDYTVSINSVGEGGTFNFTTPPATGTNWLFKRIVSFIQGAVIPTEGNLPGPQLENQLDLAVMMNIQMNEALGRCIQLPINFTGSVTLPTPEDGFALTWLGTDGTMQNSPINAGAVSAGIAAAAASAAAAAGSQSAAAASAAAAAASAASMATKATQAQAEAGIDDTAFMTALKVKQEVQKAGNVAIPAANISGGGFGVRSARTFGQNYLAATDGEVNAFAFSGSTQTELKGYSDGTATPSAVVMDGEVPTNNWCGITFSVAKGQYYRVDIASGGGTGPVMTWLPKGV